MCVLDPWRNKQNREYDLRRYWVGVPTGEVNPRYDEDGSVGEDTGPRETVVINIAFFSSPVVRIKVVILKSSTSLWYGGVISK